MKFRKNSGLWLLCTALICCFCACNPISDQQETVAQNAVELYETALIPIRNADNFVSTITMDLQWQVGEEHFSESLSCRAYYQGYGTASMDAYIDQTLCFGTGESEYAEFYTGGRAYCQSGASIFAWEMTAKEFTDRQLPAILLNPALYRAIALEAGENRTLIRFSQAMALENWAANSDAVLLSANGTATLDAEGNLLQSAYQAEYRLGLTVYTLEVTNKVATESALVLSSKFPSDLADCISLSQPDAVRALLQATGYIRSAQAISCSYEEQLDCKAAHILRRQQVRVHTYGSGDSFAARTDYTASITDYTGTPAITTQSELFLDGRKSVSVNNSAAIEQTGHTAETMRSYCENCVLSAVFPIAYLADARLETAGNGVTLRFTGTEALANALCSSIYESLQTGNLDSFCESYTTDAISGYLTFDAETRLPVEAGLLLTRTHIIGGISYELCYKLDSRITLASADAYDAITVKP